MTATEHRLKVWPEFFADLVTGAKRFEVRKADRNFAVGDTLMLLEFDARPDWQNFTGRWLRFTVNYVVKLDGIGIPGYVGIGLGLCLGGEIP